MATGQNSYNCQEDSCSNPVADSLINFQPLYNLCQEEVVNMTFQKGKPSAFKGHKHTETANKKNSEAHKGLYDGDKNPFYGKHHTEETKRKLSLRLKGHVAWNKGTQGTYSDETIKKMSAGQKKRFETEETWNKGKTGIYSEEALQRNAEAHRGKPSWNKGNRGCCSVETIKKLSESHKGIIPSEDTLRKRSEALKGENHYNWKGGISFEPYCSKFNNELKERIRERDNRVCQLCGEKENGRKHSVHHIHYDKPNCDPDLVALCVKCNAKVNHRRDYWEEHFMNKLKERGLVN